SNLTVQKADWLRDNKVRILLQYGAERLASLKGVPTVVELTRNEADRTALGFYALKFSMSRPLILPPDVPADRVQSLQQAFAATMQDPQYLNDARRMGLDTNWLGAGDVAKLIRQIEDAPQPAIDHLRELLARVPR